MEPKTPTSRATLTSLPRHQRVASVFSQYRIEITPFHIFKERKKVNLDPFFAQTFVDFRPHFLGAHRPLDFRASESQAAYQPTSSKEYTPSPGPHPSPRHIHIVYVVGFDHGLPCRVKNMAQGTQ